jgi:hypothetical protein
MTLSDAKTTEQQIFETVLMYDIPYAAEVVFDVFTYGVVVEFV